MRKLKTASELREANRARQKRFQERAKHKKLGLVIEHMARAAKEVEVPMP